MSVTTRWCWPGVRGAAANGLLAGLLVAQQAPDLRAGARVRVTLEGASALRLVGRLEAVKDDTLRLRIWREGFGQPFTVERCAVPLSGVAALEISRGTRGHAVRGAVYGGLLGAGFGVAAGLASGDELGMSAGERALAGGASFALFGAAVGALVGAANRSEVWERVPVAHLPAVRPVVLRNRLGLGLTLRL